ncbi:hypothetical protein D3C76_1281540 [compost metagenome]
MLFLAAVLGSEQGRYLKVQALVFQNCSAEMVFLKMRSLKFLRFQKESWIPGYLRLLNVLYFNRALNLLLTRIHSIYLNLLLQLVQLQLMQQREELHCSK